jgi:hypothetical protein
MAQVPIGPPRLVTRLVVARWLVAWWLIGRFVVTRVVIGRRVVLRRQVVDVARRLIGRFMPGERILRLRLERLKRMGMATVWRLA